MRGIKFSDDYDTTYLNRYGGAEKDYKKMFMITLVISIILVIVIVIEAIITVSNQKKKSDAAKSKQSFSHEKYECPCKSSAVATENEKFRTFIN